MEVSTRAPGRALDRIWGWKWRLLALLVFVGLTGLALTLNARRGQPPVVVAASGPAPVVAEAGVVPRTQRKLTFQTSGTLKDLTVKVGDQVRAGDVVARLDSAALALKVQDARANLDLQKATIAQQVEAAPVADVAAARAQLDSALAKQKSVEAGASTGDLTAAEESVAAARAAVDDAQAHYQKLLNGPTAADVSQAQAGVRAAEAQLAAAQQKQSDLKARPKPEDVKSAQLGGDQAKNTLWAQQVTRDQTCGSFGPNSTQCKSANATVASAETAVQTAQANLDKVKEPASPDEITAATTSVESAQTSLASARAQLAQVQSGSASPDKDAARAQVDQATANLRGAQAKLDQLRSGSTNADVVAAQAAVEQARDGLDKLTRTASPATIDLGRARIQAAQVAVDEAQQALDNAVIRAPIGGVVTSIDAKPGEVVGPGAPVLTVADLSTLQFQTKDLDEISAARIFVGQTVRVTIPALEKRVATGTVVEINPEPSITASGDVSYVATIALQNPPPGLRWGQSGRVEFVPKAR